MFLYLTDKAHQTLANLSPKHLRQTLNMGFVVCEFPLNPFDIIDHSSENLFSRSTKLDNKCCLYTRSSGVLSIKMFKGHFLFQEPFQFLLAVELIGSGYYSYSNTESFTLSI